MRPHLGVHQKGMHLEVRFWEVLFIEEREALYLGGHKVGYRAMKGTERGVLYKKNNEEVFQFCTSFIQVGGKGYRRDIF